MNDKQLPSTPLHLDAAFSDIAASAGAAATGGTTGTVEVHRLVKRSRRRRAAAFGTGGFVLLGVAGIGLSGLLAPAPVEILPAPPVPTPTPTADVVEPLGGTFAPVCGDDLSELLATTTPLTLGPDPSDVAGETPLKVTNTGDASLTTSSTGFVAVYLLDAEGQVVSSSTTDEPSTEGARTSLDLAPGESGPLGLAGIGRCGDAPLPTAGTYTAVGTLATELTPVGGTATASTVVGGPWTVAIDDRGRVTSLDGHAVALPVEPETPPEAPEPPTHLPGAFDGEKVTFPAPQTMNDTFQCGQPAPAATGDELLARLEVVGPVPVLDASSRPTIPGRVTVSPHARPDVVDFFFLYEYVISQDGVIVSSPQTPTDSYGNVELEPGRTLDNQISLVPTATCGNGPGTPEPLAPGTYQLHATLPWMINSYALQQTDGTWGRTQQATGEHLFKGTLVSAPVTFTVQ